MKNKFLLFAAAIMLFAACEKIDDPRNHETPEKAQIAWLLSVEVDQLPHGTIKYGCVVADATTGAVKYEAKGDASEIPYLFQIPGALLLGNYATAIACVTSTGDTIIPIIDVPTFDELEEYHLDEKSGKMVYEYKTKVEYDTLGVKGKFHFRYD